MYLAVSASLLILRKRKGLVSTVAEFDWYRHSDFNPIFSTVSAMTTVIISLICVLAFAYLQFTAFVIFIACSLVYVFLIRKK